MIDAIVWYLWMQVFGIAGWLLSRRLLGGLPDRGYGASKTLGLILGGFAYWILVTLGLADNNIGAILLALLSLVVAGLVLGRGAPIFHTPIRISIRTIPRQVWWTEGVFLAAFALAALFRAYVPDISEAGGEKYMESMFINAILRSPTFPPNDAWLSGFPISYYYFGYVLLARYNIRFVVVGDLEAAYYARPGLDKFERMADLGYLRRAYANEGTRIYAVVE